MASPQTFSAQVSEWVRQTESRMEMVFKASSQEVFSRAQTPKAQGGNLPVDTGNLRNTFVAGLNGTTSLTGPDAYIAAIAGSQLGDRITGGWTAEYAPRMEFGFVGQDSLGRTYNQEGNGFVRKAVMDWQSIVTEMSNRAKARFT